MFDERYRARNGRAPAAADAALSTAAITTKQEIRELRARVEFMNMAMQAMWEFVSSTTGWTDEHLAERIEHIDQRDGYLDGRRRVPPQLCSCGAMVNAASRTCDFCGVVPERPVFDRR